MSRYPLPNKNHEVVKDIETLQETFVAMDEDIVALENKTAEAKEKITKANNSFVHTDVSLADSTITNISPRRYLAVSEEGIKCVDSSDNVGGRNGQCSVKKSDANFDVAWGDIWSVSKNGTTTLQNASEAGQNEAHIFCDVPEIDNEEQLPRNNLTNVQTVGDLEIESNQGVVLIDSLEQPTEAENFATRKNRGIVKVGPGVHVMDGSISIDTAQNATKDDFGIVKIGDSIQVENEAISIAEIPHASINTFGLIKLGKNFQINENGAMEVKEMPTTIYDLGKTKIASLGNVDLEESVAHYRMSVTEDLVITFNLSFEPREDFAFVLDLVSDGTHLISFTDILEPKMPLMPINRGTTRIRISKKIYFPHYHIVIDRADAPTPVNLVESRKNICEDYIAYAPKGSNWSVPDILRDYYDGYNNTRELHFEFTKLVCVDFVKYWSRSSNAPMGEFILKGSNDGRNWTTLLYRNGEVIYGEVRTDVKGCFRYYNLFIGYTSDDNKPGGISLWGTEIEDNDLTEFKALTPYMSSNTTAFATLTSSKITNGTASNITDNNYSSYIYVEPADDTPDTSRWVKYELTEPAAANVLEIDMHTWSEQANWFKLEGSNDDENWDLIIERQYQENEIYLQGKALFYHLNNEIAYKYYKLTCVSTNSTSTRWVLCGFKLFQYKYRESRPLFQSLTPIMSSTSQDGYEISASSQAGGGETVLQAFDGNTETQWTTTGGGAVGSWVRLKLPTATICTAMSIKARNNQWYYQAPIDFEIQASDDGGNWITLSTESGLSWVQGEQKDFFFKNETAYLYYRIHINAVQSENYAGFAKLEFGNTVLEYRRYLKKYDYLVPPLTSNTSAPGYVVSATSEYSNDEGAWRAFDRLGNQWTTKNGRNKNIALKIKLPTAQTCTHFKIAASDARGRIPSIFRIEGSNDDTNWTTLYDQSVAAGFSPYETRIFENPMHDVAFQYYRLYVVNNAGDGFLSLQEFNLVRQSIVTEY
ncbi:MAG: discoidin domain-containing protein [Alphaproteobacteria bacterium]|nr:discoidin domain-containing protein [Alphaproteobacteria bacterium]